VSLSLKLDQFKDIILDLLFPPQCIGCGSKGSFLCSSCERSLLRLNPPFCEKCGKPLIRGSLCPTCFKQPLAAIDGIRSPFLFRDLVREAIHYFKYRNYKVLARPLGQLLADYLASNPLPVDVLVPVPLHPKRLRQRGYNQSSLLAMEIGRILSLPVVKDSLVRAQNTPSQINLRAEERRKNVQGAFKCRDERLRGRKVILIDDVCTTGATLDACAKALKDIGATSVWGLTLAREI